MGQAREVMDRMTMAMQAKDKETLASCYAADAVAYTPDHGEVRGREAITTYLSQFWEVLPDFRFELRQGHEAGNVAIDEGFAVGTNSGPIRLPSGQMLQPTGKQVRLRSCDIVRVEAGEITSHQFYFDQMDFLGQLGLLPELSTH